MPKGVASGRRRSARPAPGRSSTKEIPMTEDLAAATVRLVEVLAAENAALAALDLPRPGATLAAKTCAADAFVAVHRALNGGTPGPKGAASRLRAPVEENQRLLANAITIQGRVIGIIGRALPRALRDPAATRYGAHGRATPARMAAVAVSARAGAAPGGYSHDTD